MKWRHQLFFGMLDMTIVNAYVQFKESNNESIPWLNFRRELAQGLLTLGQQPIVQALVHQRDANLHLVHQSQSVPLGVHWPQFLPEIGRCKVCSQNGVESRPFSICSHCGVHCCCNSSKMCFSKERQKTQNSVNTKGGRYKVQEGFESPRRVSTLLKGFIRR